jgi:hypothetical protein
MPYQPPEDYIRIYLIISQRILKKILTGQFRLIDAQGINYLKYLERTSGYLVSWDIFRVKPFFRIETGNFRLGFCE